jgi:hypothetical protein
MTAPDENSAANVPHVVICRTVILESRERGTYVLRRSIIGPFPDRHSAVSWGDEWIRNVDGCGYEIAPLEAEAEAEERLTGSRDARRKG